MLETINSNYKLQVWSGNAINNEKVGVIRHREMKGKDLFWNFTIKPFILWDLAIKTLVIQD